MKKYKYITIDQFDQEYWKKKPLYRIKNNRHGYYIGLICWYPDWKQYVFCSEQNSVFNNDCLRDVLDFMENHAGKGETNGKGN